MLPIRIHAKHIVLKVLGKWFLRDFQQIRNEVWEDQLFKYESTESNLRVILGG